MRDVRIWAMLAFCFLIVGLGVIGLMGMGGLDNVFISTVVHVFPHFFDPSPMGAGVPILAIAGGGLFATATIVSALRQR